MNMSKELKALIFAIIGSIIGELILGLIGISEAIPNIIGNLFQNRIFRFGLLTFLLFLIILGIQKRRESIEKRNYRNFVLGRNKPNNLLWVGYILKYGVWWNVFYGKAFRSRGSPYAYSEGPFCPDCETKLNSRHVPSYWILEKHIWSCPNCGFEIERPGEYYEEDKNVAKICESEIEKVIYGQFDKSYIEDKEDFQTIDWNI